MFDALESGIGLETVLRLQDIRFGLLNGLVQFLDFAGDELFYIIIFGLIYWTFNKKLGLRMLMGLVVVSLLTFLAKDILGRERPYQVSDAVIPLFHEHGFGIPSGHTSMTLMVWGYLAWWLRRRDVWVAVIGYVVMQAFSRMIAGVHFPQDVLGGIVLGAIVLALYIPLAERFAAVWSGWATAIQAGVTVTAAVLLSVMVMLAFDDIARWEDYLTMAGLLLGAGLGVIFEREVVRFVPHPNQTRRLIQYVIGIALTIVLLFGLKFAFAAITETGYLAGALRVIRYGIVTFFALGIYPYISIRAGLAESEKVKNEAFTMEGTAL